MLNSARFFAWLCHCGLLCIIWPNYEHCARQTVPEPEIFSLGGVGGGGGGYGGEVGVRVRS